MRYPHKNYIKTLVAGRMSNQDILLDLQDHDLMYPPKEYVNKLREEMKIGHEEYFDDKSTELDPRWLDDWSIEAMFGYKFNYQVSVNTEPVENAFEILNNTLMYRAISSLSLCNVPLSDIELVINAKYDLEYSSNDLDTFIHYFFQTEDWNYREKVQFVDIVEDRGLSSFYRIALDNERDYLLWKLELAPSVSFDNMLRDILHDCYFNFKEQARKNSSDAQNWGKLALKVSERLEQVEADEEQKQDMYQDLKIMLTTEDDASVSRKPKTQDPEELAKINLKEDNVSPSIVSREDLN